MKSTLTSAAGLRFVKFDIERCIRIVTEDGEHCLPIDPRQCEDILAPIALDGSLSIGDHQRLNLITIEIGGASYAAMDTIDGSSTSGLPMQNPTITRTSSQKVRMEASCGALWATSPTVRAMPCS